MCKHCHSHFFIFSGLKNDKRTSGESTYVWAKKLTGKSTYVRANRLSGETPWYHFKDDKYSTHRANRLKSGRTAAG